MRYKVLDKEYADLFELAKDAYLHSDYFSTYFKSEEFLDMLKESDEDKADKISRLSRQMLPDDIFVFKASYILNPFMSFRIRGWCFRDYEELGEALLSFGPDYNVTLMEIIRFQLISKHMESTGFSKEDPELFKKVLEAEFLAERDAQLAYFTLGYLLSRETGIIYRQVRYKDIKNLTFYLVKSDENLDDLGNSFSHSPLLRAYSTFHKEENLEEFLHLIDTYEKNREKLDDFLSEREEKNSFERKKALDVLTDL